MSGREGHFGDPPPFGGLRDRIAAALAEVAEGRALYQTTSADVAVMADAVIRELGLEVEDGECGYCHAQLPGCRYSTWKADDD